MSSWDTESCCIPGSGCCDNKGINRRDFMKSAALAAGAAGLFGIALDDACALTPEEKATALGEWKRTLWDLGQRRVYVKDELKNIAMPQGGFGAGQLYVRGDGSLGPWQILNNFNSNAEAFGGFFGIYAKNAQGQTVARLLQEKAIGECPGVSEIAYSGEYPFAWLNYRDAALPVEVSMECYSPFIPLNTKDSALPSVIFSFRVKNMTAAPIETAVMASMPNLSGWDGNGKLTGLAHDEFVRNANQVAKEAGRTSVVMGSEPGVGHTLNESREFYTNSHAAAHTMRMCSNLSVHFSDPIRLEKDARPSVYWLGAIGNGNTADQLRALLAEVEKGATLVVSGGEDSLIAAARGTSKRTDVADVFENFENDFANWTLEGNCFDGKPTAGTLPGQQAVSGFRDTYLVNSYVNGDDAQGKATSKPFTIAKHYIHVLVGGGQWPNETCVNLRIGDAVVATATGENTEKLRAILWNVTEHVGKEARIEIVDKRVGGWGHVLVDEILFSDSPVSPFLDEAIRDLATELLPFKWKTRTYSQAPSKLSRKSDLLNGIERTDPTTGARWHFIRFRPKRGAKVLLKTEDGDPLVVSRKHGNGKIVACTGPVEQWMSSADRKNLVGNILANAAGTMYEPLTGWSATSPVSGTMSLSALHPDTSELPQWNDVSALWSDFAQDGRFDAATNKSGAAPQGETWGSAIAVPTTLAPGEEKTLTFVLAWHFPNRTRDQRYWWTLEPVRMDFRLGNKYSTWFQNANEVVAYVADNLPRLDKETRLFHETVYDSTLPRWFNDCITANIAITRSPIYIWLEDGTVGGYEGTDNCCPLNCTHVYNYAMSTAYILPEAERNVRELELLVQMHSTEHYIPHRLIVPLSEPRAGKEIGGPHHPALDGELGAILKTYREWRLCGDKQWLEKLWPRVKTHMEYIMATHDLQGDGVIRGEQPNTYDTHIFGSNTFIGALYLAALRASEEMAKYFEDTAFATVCRDRFNLGSANYDKTCWNGEYYINVFDTPDAKPETYNENNCYGPGCFTDQLLGQWWAHLMHLGHVLPADHVKMTLQSIFRYNWRDDLSEHKHNQRVFAEGVEKGLLTGSWPKGGRPERPILYCDEVWTGLEYHIAATMFAEGMTDEGMMIVRGARDRYTGNQRNPWSEIECGGHYARAMSSYGLLLAVAGLDYHAGKQSLSFAPKVTPEQFMCFFTAGSAWGNLEQDRFGQRQRNIVIIKYGELSLHQLAVGLPDGVIEVVGDVAIGQVPVAARISGAEGQARFLFPDGIVLGAGDALMVNLRW